MGANEKLVPGELLNELLSSTTMPPELIVWAQQSLKNKSTVIKFCQTKNINEEIT